MSTVERFWTKVDRREPDECWPWQAALDRDGYGCFYDGKRMVAAHRFAYGLAYGAIPAGLTIDHVAKRGCTQRNCMNPAHLEAVTFAENVARRIHRTGPRRVLKTHCKRGHPLAGDNLYLRTTPGGAVWRVCKICQRAAERECRSRKKAALAGGS